MAGRGGVHTIPPYVWLVKTDATGKMEWNQTYDYLLNAAGLVQTSDGGYVMAGDSYTTKEGYWGITYPQGIMLVKTDLNGNVKWSQTYKDWSGGASSMVQTNDGGYVIAGSSDNSGFLIKSDSSGKIQLKKTYGEPNKHNSFSSVIQTGDGGYAAAGTTNFNDTNAFWLVKTDGYGNVMWSQTYGSGDNQANSVVQTADGGYALVGHTFTYSADGFSSWSNVWLVKTDSLGNMVWNQTYGGYAYVYSLIQTSDGGLAFAGNTPSSAWLVKLDAAGNAEWNQTYPKTHYGDVSANCLIETSDGGFALAGSWDFTGSANYYYLVKTEPALPPPTPSPTPTSSSSPLTDLFSGSNLILFASLAAATVLIALVAVAVFRRRKKQTSPTSFT